ncbi:MAG: N-acetylmuramoyl-L-alanine amidase [Planctomycetota bacterium]
MPKNCEVKILKDGVMPNQARVAKVLATLLTSMTIGAIVLMALGHNPPSAGPFSLWTYYRLDPVNKAISSQAAQSQENWNNIQIYYSSTTTGNIEQLASLNGLENPDDINCHFCVYNGSGGSDGQIQTTKKWQKQSPAASAGDSKSIRICIIADGKTKHPTDCQLKRMQVLVDALCKKFNIQFSSIKYPSEWR